MKFAYLQAMQMVPHFAISLLVAHPPIPLFEHCPPSNGCAFWQNALFTFTTKLQFIS